MTIPTLEKLVAIYDDAYLTYPSVERGRQDVINAAIVAVRDAVLEGAAQEAERWPRPNPDPLEFSVDTGAMYSVDACADDITAAFLRSLKGQTP